MASTSDRAVREARQARVAKAVWGLLLVTMGGLFTLDNLGRVNLRPPGPYPASHAVDGDLTTRWSSAFDDPQWITVDLGSVSEISRVRLSWEAAFARAYRIEVSTDGQAFVPVREVANGDGGVDDHEVQATGRYVRMTATERATPYGDSLWEFEVLGPAGPLSTGRPARASSGEGRSLWALYWPLLLVGAGLPALLAPKDGGDQLIGLMLAGTGVLFQIQRLQLVSWTLAEVWPIVLIGAGLLLVIQALRQGESKPADWSAIGGGDSGGSGR